MQIPREKVSRAKFGIGTGSGLASAPMPLPPDTALPPRIRRRLDRWLVRWGTPSLVRTLRVEFSPRLTRAFGRCYQQQKLIRLTPSLLDSQSWLLAEILCHEAAHAAVHDLHGASARPHGEEWEDLMRAAGFEPRVRIPVVVRAAGGEATRPRVAYLHRCPLCEASRRATRPMHQWRCRTCEDTRTRGRLEIERVERHAAGRRQAAAQGRRSRQRVAASNGRAKSASRGIASPRSARSR